MTINESTKKARDIVTSYDGPKLRIMEVCGTLRMRSLDSESGDFYQAVSS